MKEKFLNLFKQDRPMSVSQTLLTIVFTMALVMSNIISSRTFNFFGFTMTSAVIIFPITYILSDVFSQVYGYKWSRATCYIAFSCNFFAVLIFFLVSKLPTLPWMEETASAFNVILGGVNACTFASLIAYVVGDFANDKVFQKMLGNKKYNDLTGFGARAILSSLVGELLDSSIYLPLAFLVFNPIMTVKDCFTMVVLQVLLKTGYEILILPLTTYITKHVAGYEFNLENK